MWLSSGARVENGRGGLLEVSEGNACRAVSPSDARVWNGSTRPSLAECADEAEQTSFGEQRMEEVSSEQARSGLM